jgi:hypothetical protein
MNSFLRRVRAFRLSSQVLQQITLSLSLCSLGLRVEWLGSCKLEALRRTVLRLHITDNQ